MNKVSTPLPKNLQQWVPVILATIFVVLIFVASVAVAQHQADDQFIGKEELKRNIEDLASYNAEAQLVAQYYQRHIASRAFVQNHSSELQEAVDSVAEKLQEHPHADGLDDRINQTVDSANQLSDQLDELAIEPVEQLPDQSQTYQFFNNLSNKLDSLETGL